MRKPANYRMINTTRKIYISPYLTPKQLAENHELVDKQKRRRIDGESVKIKSGQIVNMMTVQISGRFPVISIATIVGENDLQCHPKIVHMTICTNAQSITNLDLAVQKTITL